MSIEGQKLVDFGEKVESILSEVRDKVGELCLLIESQHSGQFCESMNNLTQLERCLSGEGVVFTAINQEILKPASSAYRMVELARQLKFIQETATRLEMMNASEIGIGIAPSAKNLNIAKAVESLGNAMNAFPCDVKDYLCRTEQGQP